MIFFIIYENRVSKFQETEFTFTTDFEDINNYANLQGSQPGQGVME